MKYVLASSLCAADHRSIVYIVQVIDGNGGRWEHESSVVSGSECICRVHHCQENNNIEEVPCTHQFSRKMEGHLITRRDVAESPEYHECSNLQNSGGAW